MIKHLKYTYFIAENEDNDHFPVKIGFSKNPKKRIRELQAGNSRKLALMGWIECEDQSLETNIFKKYESYNLNGEWFAINNVMF